MYKHILNQRKYGLILNVLFIQVCMSKHVENNNEMKDGMV